MAGYVVGTQAWYDAVRRRLVGISKELRSPGTSQAEKNRLYGEQAYLVESLDKYAHENLVNTPIE